MSGDRPSVVLLRCPICVEDPYWHYARSSSRKRGHDCFIFTGCSHAKKIGADRVLDEPNDWREVERRWNELFEATLASTTERWTDAQRAAYRRRLEWKNELRGATESFAFSPVHPAQQNNEPTKEENHHG